MALHVDVQCSIVCLFASMALPNVVSNVECQWSHLLVVGCSTSSQTSFCSVLGALRQESYMLRKSAANVPR
jgi:hypothetical protein